MIDEADLRQIGEARWAAPILELILDRNGVRFAEIASSLGMSKDSVSRTLDHLISARWVVRHAGHGHPLRPEYVLTTRGVTVAAACARLMAARRRLGIGVDALPRWSLPVLVRLERRWLRFGALREELAPVTPAALSANLKQMIEGGLIARRVEPSFPPASNYGLAKAGCELVKSLLA